MSRLFLFTVDMVDVRSCYQCFQVVYEHVIRIYGWCTVRSCYQCFWSCMTMLFSLTVGVPSYYQCFHGVHEQEYSYIVLLYGDFIIVFRFDMI